MVDFTGLLGVPGHSCSSGATDPILSTQRIPRWGDPIVSTVQDASDFQAILDGALKNGGDASENGDFQRRKQRLQGPFFSGALILYSERENQGDDATENDNFQRGKQRLQGRKN